MFEGLPSFTAFYVALARGVATHEAALSRACQDPVAQQLLPTPLRLLVQRAAASPTTARALRYSQLGMFDHHAMRTALVDQALHDALARGARQLVLLGAGLDTRGHRLPALSNTIVFEIDHPLTQGYKQRRANLLQRGAREIRYATCDFERDRFADVLHDAGFDPTQPSCVIWEGVTMYLQEPAVERALDTLSHLCCSGSTLITTYLWQVPTTDVSWGTLRSILQAVAEPLRFDSSTEAMADRLKKHGFDVLADALPITRADDFGVSPLPFPAAAPAERERVVVAERM
ncbi:MAG: SAM-dependent methyltransferase [Polyangiales bacterium]